MSILTQKQNVSEQVVSPVKENRETKTKEKNNISVNVNKENNGVNKNQSLISFNDVTDSAYINSDNYQVLKEELISVKNIYVKTVTPAEKASNTDSLAASLAGVTNPSPEEFFMIEFWKTPLNSKGYKMTRNRLLIYGFPEKTDLALVKKNDNYYLRNNKMVYRLNYSSEFKPLERSADNDAADLFN